MKILVTTDEGLVIATFDSECKREDCDHDSHFDPDAIRDDGYGARSRLMLEIVDVIEQQS